MHRGTTPVLVYELDTDLDLNNLEEAWLTISGYNDSLTKTIDDLTISDIDKTVTAYFTQEETLGFSNGQHEVQLRLLFNDGSAWVTSIEKINVDRILKGGVMNG